MPCYHPLKGWKGDHGGITFNERHAVNGQPMQVPCGQCIGCRLERSRQWAIRCVHEASQYEHNCFITLTYDNEHLPSDNSLNLVHFQKFMKRLRKRFGSGIRFYHCGEYGDLYKRPHYHALLFNFDFPDKVLYSVNNGDNPLYTSDILNEIWGKGFCLIGSVTFESAAYVARYVLKKINGDKSDEHYMDAQTGVIKAKEYATMSRKPGIGRLWLDQYSDDVYPHGRVVMRGKILSPPRYYDEQYKKMDPLAYEEMKWERELRSKDHLDDATPDRLLVREAVQEERLKQLVRSVDYDS